MRVNYRLLPTFLLLALGSSVWAQLPKSMIEKQLPEEAKLLGTQSHNDYPQKCLQFSWLDSQSIWDSVSQYTYMYATNGKVTEDILSTHNGTSFAPTLLQSYRYDANWRVDSIYGETWNGSNWELDRATDYGFDPQGNLTSFWRMNWVGNVWDTTQGFREDYSYHTGDVIADTRSFDWQTSQRIWIPNDSTHYTVNPQMQWDTIVAFNFSGIGWNPTDRITNLEWQDFAERKPLTGTNWSYDLGVWSQVERFRTSYATNRETWVWDTYNSGQWDSTSMNIIVNDNHDHLISDEEFVWIGSWLQESGEFNTYTYDGGGRMLLRVMETYDGYLYRLDRRFEYDNFFTSAIEATNNALQATAYPNPIKGNDGRLTFLLELARPGFVSVTLYDLKGHKRAETFVSHSSGELCFPIGQSLESGTYTYQIICSEGKASGKVVLLR